jgi:hypothetical protein
MKTEENLIKKKSGIKSLEDINKTAAFLAHDISNFLFEEIEELNIYSYKFRTGMERCLNRVLISLEKQTQPVVIFPDSIPGFTMMVFRKVVQTNIELEVIKEKRNPVEEVKELQILDTVISRFFNKNQQKVILLETEDMLFSLFPVTDTRKNLKEMGLYITF